ncbi:amino acid adenylation domain-containing protein [Micromonospora sp. NPDC051300]|uniref:amino acid adenylation domain-containing protein n=1 Tax=Micromonospora sp. NPDC051300 TaxID=3364286 RepID=UPI003797DBB3
MDDPTLAPVSPGQERLWFLHRLTAGEPTHHISVVSRLAGALDRTALTAAYDAVTTRHESLRTAFVDLDGTPRQRVLPPRPTTIAEIDLRHLPPAERDTAAQTRLDAALREPFDLADGHLLRAILLRLDDEDHLLATVVHHIVADGWSTNLLYRDLALAYNGQTLAPPPRPYTEVVRDRHSQAADPEVRAYWRDALADPPVLDLPTDRPRPAERGSDAGAVEFRVPAATVRAVRDLATELRCTPFMVLMAVYQLLLAQHSDADDICVGTPVAGRDDVDLEDVVGYLSDVVVIRGDLSGEPTARELIRRTRTALMGALTHQGIPFEQLVADLDLPRDASRNALFQTTFTMHSTLDVATTTVDDFAGLAVAPHRTRPPGVAVDLALEATVVGDAVDAVLVYRADLFTASTVERLAAAYTDLLAAVTAEPDLPLHQLPLVHVATRNRLLAAGAGPPLDTADHAGDLVARTAAARPWAVAMISGDERVSYADLIDAADGYARRLHAEGVRPGDLVAVSLPRGPHLVAALLGTWRAGAGYVPLDPALPPARHAALATEAGVTAVVDPTGVHRRTPRPRTVAPETAYVLFTSGSTGQPKAVTVGHAALADRVAWMVPAYELGAGDHMVQFASVGFDTHAEEIWPTLAAGGTLVLLPDGPATLPDVLATNPQVTVLDLPTAYWQALLDVVTAWPPALRLVILGGEQVDAGAVAAWRDRHGDRVRLVNTYGPTEATIIATAIDLGADDAHRRPPIGRPVGGVRAYVLDRHGRLVAPGTVGELCLAGAGLAAGYLGRPDLTDKRFRPDPYGEGLLYRTGDRARWRGDLDREPVLEFAGRLDRQLKVRGVRVEPGEVESVLAGHPDVVQAVVVARDDALVAYVAGRVEADAVREHAAGLLPALFVPTSIVTLPSLPLTRNGKVDLAALPAPHLTARTVTSAPPATDAELLVARIWSTLLRVEDIGVGDDFFAIGGHSLLATRVIARLRAAIGVDLPIRTLFARPTLAAFATAVEDALAAELAELTDEDALALLAQTGPAR